MRENAMRVIPSFQMKQQKTLCDCCYFYASPFGVGHKRARTVSAWNTYKQTVTHDSHIFGQNITFFINRITIVSCCVFMKGFAYCILFRWNINNIHGMERVPESENRSSFCIRILCELDHLFLDGDVFMHIRRKIQKPLFHIFCTWSHSLCKEMNNPACMCSISMITWIQERLPQRREIKPT